MAVEAEVQESVESEWITIDGEELEFTFVNDGPSTHEDYLKYLKYMEEVENDKQRKRN